MPNVPWVCRMSCPAAWDIADGQLPAKLRALHGRSTHGDLPRRKRRLSRMGCCGVGHSLRLAGGASMMVALLSAEPVMRYFNSSYVAWICILATPVGCGQKPETSVVP